MRETEKLVEMFWLQPRPLSGVVSRSRLRAWFFEAGGREEQWPEFVRALVAKKMWVPWYGDDVESLRNDGPPRVGYREAASHPPRQASFSTLRPTMFIMSVSLLVLAALLFVRFGEPSWWCSAVFVVLALVDLALMRVRYRRYEVDTHAGRLKIKSSTGEHIELDLADILWVDLDAIDRSNLASVTARTRDGELVDLTDRFNRHIALEFCRMIESAMIDAEKLTVADRARVRTEAPPAPDAPAEHVEISEAEDEQAAEA